MPKRRDAEMMADMGAPLAAVTAAPPAPPCPILPALPCPALPSLPRPAALPTIVIVMIIVPTFLLPLWIRIPQQRSLRNSSFHRSLAPRRSIDRSCAPLLHFSISDPQSQTGSSPPFSSFLYRLAESNIIQISQRRQSFQRELLRLFLTSASTFVPSSSRVFRLLSFCFSFCFAEVPMRASNLVLFLLSPFLFPY